MNRSMQGRVGKCYVTKEPSNFYESWKLIDGENNYATHDLELAAIIHALKMWRHYLMGNKFMLKIDNASMKYLFEQPNLNAKKA